MLFRPVVHELDSNAVFLRQQIIALHHKKLSQIKTRKNLFEVETSTSLSQKQLMKMKMQGEKLNPNSGFHNSQTIKENNDYLINKIAKIKKRSNKTIFPDLFLENTKTRNKSNLNIKAIRNKQIEEDNHLFNSRLSQKSSCINVKKMEEDFKLSQAVYKRLRRIKPSNISVNNIYEQEDNLLKALEISLVNHLKNKSSKKNCKQFSFLST